MSNDKLWGSAFYNNVSANDRERDIKFNQLKPEVNDVYEKDGKKNKI